MLILFSFFRIFVHILGKYCLIFKTCNDSCFCKLDCRASPHNNDAFRVCFEVSFPLSTKGVRANGPSDTCTSLNVLMFAHSWTSAVSQVSPDEQEELSVMRGGCRKWRRRIKSVTASINTSQITVMMGPSYSSEVFPSAALSADDEKSRCSTGAQVDPESRSEYHVNYRAAKSQIVERLHGK